MTPNRSVADFPADRLLLATVAAVIVAVTVVLYHGWLMPFFQPYFAGREAFARAVFYSLYGSLLFVSAAVFVTRADVRRTVLPCAIVAAVGLLACALHPIALVTKAYIIAVGMGGTVIVLMLGSSPGLLLRLTAAVTALNAGLCFVDVLFADGFTTTGGRAAGLALNPNVAAASVLLGAAASYRAVPRTLQLSFLTLVAGALAITMSRSNLLIATAAVAVPAGVEIWRRLRTQRPFDRLEGVRPAAFLLMTLLAWTFTAAATNPHFQPVLQAVVDDSLSFVTALDEAHDSVAAAAQHAPAPSVSVPAASTPSASVPSVSVPSVSVPSAPAPLTPPSLSSARIAAPSTPTTGPAAPAPDRPPVAVVPRPADAQRIAALDERLAGEGGRNSASARTLFLERSLLVYRNADFFGKGLEAAHPLAPHNTFVLFALAFGHVGWLIPLALVGLAIYAARDARDLPLSIAMVGTMATSHDILVTPSLFLPIAVGIGGMLAGRAAGSREPRVHRAIAVGSTAAVVLFVAGCALIVRDAPRQTIERLNPANIIAYRGAYLTRLPPQTFPGLFVQTLEERPWSTASFLRDDSRPLLRVAESPRGYPTVAPGEYAAVNGVLLFAPADSRDPRTSGRVVELGLPRKVGTPFYALVAALTAWCAGVILWFDRRDSARDHLGVEA